MPNSSAKLRTKKPPKRRGVEPDDAGGLRGKDSSAGQLTVPVCGPYDFSYAISYARARSPLPLGSHLYVNDVEPNSPEVVAWAQINGRPCRVILRQDTEIANPEIAVSYKLAGTMSVKRPEVELSVANFVRRVISADLDLAPFYRLLSTTTRLENLPRERWGMKPFLTTSVFDSVLWAIVGQQVTLSFAVTLKERIRARFGHTARIGDLTHTLAPEPDDLARIRITSLRQLQLSEAKAKYIQIAARASLSGDIPLAQLGEMPYDEALLALTAVKGIGVWSANYILMRGAGHSDALPLGDAGLRRAIKAAWNMKANPDDKKIERLAEPFRPYRSLFTLYMWSVYA